MNSCPKCEEAYTDQCWRCGYNVPVEGDGYQIVFYTTPAPNKLTGGSSKYYELPEGCKELQDLIEYKNMNFAMANIFKATYRLGNKPGTDMIYDLEKIIWFANREIERIKKYES